MWARKSQEKKVSEAARDHGGENIHTNNTSNLILDAFVRWKFYNNMEVWIGQTKLPGNRERVISSQKLQFVDRSLVNSRFNIDRDMGIQFRNKVDFGSIHTRQAFAISQGEGRNRTNKKDPNPANGFKDAARTGGNLGSYIQDANDQVIDSALASLNTILADVMFKYKGFSLLSEYANKTMDGTRITDEGSGDIINNYYTGTGLTVQAGYLLENNLEPAFRYTTITPELESGRDLQEMYTFGLSRYIQGHALKVQTDVSLLKETDQITLDESSEVMFRFQVEMAF